MIWRLFVYEPISEEAAAAASAAAIRFTAHAAVRVEHRVGTRSMRVLMADAATTVNPRTGRRRAISRVLDRPEKLAAELLAEAMAGDDVLFNIYTGVESDRSSAYDRTDAVFTVALPDGRAVAWFARIGGGIAPGNVHSCIRATWSMRSAGREHGHAANSARALFLKRDPKDIRQHEETVIAYAMDLLDRFGVSAPRCASGASGP